MHAPGIPASHSGARMTANKPGKFVIGNQCEAEITYVLYSPDVLVVVRDREARGDAKRRNSGFKKRRDLFSAWIPMETSRVLGFSLETRWTKKERAKEKTLDAE